jgi:hypothetical protein
MEKPSNRKTHARKAPTRVPGEKERFLLQTRSILSHTYRSGFVSGIFSKMIAEGNPHDGGDLTEVAYAMSEEAYREMSEKIDLEWEIEFLDLAYEIAQESHEGIIRDSGEPYFTHPLAVAKITLEDFPNPTTFKAIVALLHDVIEDAEDPEKKRMEILSRFAAKAEEKRESFVKKSGAENAEKKISFMKSFAESIVEAVELLSKKRKESYLRGWEHPFLLFENAVNDASSFAPPFLWWSPLARPPKIWNVLMKDRADEEYFSRFEFILSNRLFIAVLYVKLADRYHNLLTPKPDNHDPSKPDIKALKKVVDETEKHYLPMAERLDPRIHEMLRMEVDRLKGLLAVDAAKSRSSAAVKQIVS